MKNNKILGIEDTKIVGAAMVGYGLFYLFVIHEEIMMYGIDWVIMGFFGLNGLPHYLHKPFGLLMILSGTFIFKGRNPFSNTPNKK